MLLRMEPQTPEQKAAAVQLNQVFTVYGAQLRAVAAKASPRIGAALVELLDAVSEAADA